MAARQQKSRGLVLMGFAESLAAIECAWSLLAAGFEVVAFTRSLRKPPLAYSRRIKVHRITSPQHDARAAVADLATLASRYAGAVLFPVDDDAIWLCDRLTAQGGDVPIVVGPTGAHAALALDKRLQLEMAARAGIAVPPTAIVEPGAGGPFIPSAPGPWIVKPALAIVEDQGKLRRGSAATATSEDSVNELVKRSTEPLLIQPRLRGIGEGLFGFAAKGGVIGWSGHQRIRMMNPAGSGSSACRSVEPNSDLTSAGGAFVAEADWRGLFMLELLRTADDTAWFMELNGRPWGSMALARRRGLDYPAWAVAAAIDTSFEPEPPDSRSPVTARHLGRELLHIAFVIRGPAPGEDQDWPTLPATLRSVASWHREDRWYNVRHGESRVLVADTWQTVATKLRSGKAAR